MPYARKRKRSSSRGRPIRRRPYTRPRVKKVSFKYRKALNRIVDTRIHANAENKYASVTLDPTQIPAVIDDNSVVSVFPIVPAIGKGAGSFNRIGDKVSPRYMEIRGWLTLDMNDTDQDYDRVVVRIILGKAKKAPLYSDAAQDIIDNPGSNWASELIHYGNNAGSFNGSLFALQSPVNTGVFSTMLERRITLTRPRFYDAPLVGSDSFRYSGNSTRFFRMRVKCPKQFIYRAPNVNTAFPNNFAPMLCVGYTLLNGSTPASPPLAPTPVTISYTTRLTFEDA